MPVSPKMTATTVFFESCGLEKGAVGDVRDGHRRENDSQQARSEIKRRVIESK